MIFKTILNVLINRRTINGKLRLATIRTSSPRFSNKEKHIKNNFLIKNQNKWQ